MVTPKIGFLSASELELLQKRVIISTFDMEGSFINWIVEHKLLLLPVSSGNIISTLLYISGFHFPSGSIEEKLGIGLFLYFM